MVNLKKSEYKTKPLPGGLYTDEAFYNHFKTIRNKIRKFDTIQLIRVCLIYLHTPSKNQLNYLERHPWSVLLLIKWALIDENSLRPVGRNGPSEQQLFNILNLMRDLGSNQKARMPSEYDNIRLFLRAMAYQQFFYQRKVSFTAIARQFFYFGSVPTESYISSRFRQLTGIEISRFLELAQILLSRFEDEKENLISEDWFSALQDVYSKIEISYFFNAISKSFEDAKSTFLERDHENINKGRKKRSSAEYWEQTPFVNFPLIKNSSGYVCIDHHVLFYCIEHYVYNRLRSDNAIIFMTNFGPLFELYVKKAIDEMGLPFIIEADIKKILGEESSVIDFIIADGDSNIFIDAKAAEMSYQGKSTHESTELIKSLETSALKAIKQAHAVLNKLPQSIDAKIVMRKRTNNFLITVTYSELYVGNGKMLAACVGEEKIETLLAGTYNHLRIPLENMYFMTIKEFELLAEVIRTKQITLTDALNYAIAKDADPYTQKFEFQQHLAAANITLAEPEYLRSKAVSELEALAGRLKA